MLHSDKLQKRELESMSLHIYQWKDVSGSTERLLTTARRIPDSVPSSDDDIPTSIAAAAGTSVSANETYDL